MKAVQEQSVPQTVRGGVRDPLWLLPAYGAKRAQMQLSAEQRLLMRGDESVDRAAIRELMTKSSMSEDVTNQMMPLFNKPKDNNDPAKALVLLGLSMCELSAPLLGPAC